MYRSLVKGSQHSAPHIVLQLVIHLHLQSEAERTTARHLEDSSSGHQQVLHFQVKYTAQMELVATENAHLFSSPSRSQQRVCLPH